MTKVDRNYKLRCVGKFWTMFSEDQYGDAVASIILPSRCERKQSPTRCCVDEMTGVPTGLPSSQRWLKPATLTEMSDAEFRKRAKSNAEFIGSLARTPGMQFSFSDYVSEWCRTVKCDKLRLFYGGDAFVNGEHQLIMSLAYCAKCNPDKLIYARTTDADSVRKAEELALDYHCIIPDNLLIVVEDIGTHKSLAERFKAEGSVFSVVTFSEDEGVDDMTYFPVTDENFKIRLPKPAYITEQ